MSEKEKLTPDETIRLGQNKLAWMFEKLQTNETLDRLVKSQFACHLVSALESIRNSISFQMRDKINEGLFGLSEDDLIEVLDTPQWGKQIIPEIESALLQSCYCWRLKERYPKLYHGHIEMLGQMALVDQATVNYTKRFHFTLLALYDHDYYFNRDPAILRVVKPHKIGNSNKGKKPGAPQEDCALFVYNAEDVTAGNTTLALVSLDGKDFEIVDTSHVRMKLIKKPALIKRALATGIYTSKGVQIPVKGIRAFWQSEFIDFLRIQGYQIENDLIETYVWEQDKRDELSRVCENLVLAASRFIGDRMTAEEYWQDLQTIAEFRRILTSDVFMERVRKSSSLGSSRYTAFKMMTLL